MDSHGSHPCCEEMGDYFTPAVWEERMSVAGGRGEGREKRRCPGKPP